MMIDDYDFGCVCFLIVKKLPKHVFDFLVRSHQDILLSYTILSNMVTADSQKQDNDGVYAYLKASKWYSTNQIDDVTIVLLPIGKLSSPLLSSPLLSSPLLSSPL